MDDTERRVAVAREAAEAGASVAAEYFRSEVEVETKANPTDVVTRADRDAQREAFAVIESAFPDDALVGEEDGALKSVPDDGASWVVDPIDGTNNFVVGVPFFTTSVAAVVDGEPVAAVNVCPALGDTYLADDEATYLNGERVTVDDVAEPGHATVGPTLWWDHDRRDEYGTALTETVERFDDVRRHGSAQITFGMVGAGALSGAFSNVDPNPWDTVAGAHLVRQAGGRVTDVDGDRWRHDSQGIVASNGHVHDELLAVVAATEAVRNG